MDRIMTLDEKVADLKSQCIVGFEGFSAEHHKDSVRLKISFRDCYVEVAPRDNNVVFISDQHTLQNIPKGALRKAMGQLITELAKSEWGIDFKPGDIKEMSDGGKDG